MEPEPVEQNNRSSHGDDMLHLGLVQWDSRWRSFWESLGPALSISAPRLPMEEHFRYPRKWPRVLSLFLHIAGVALYVSLPKPVVDVRTDLPPNDHFQIVQIRPYLPQMRDTGGAEMGSTGRSGGRAWLDRRAIIRVARGSNPAEMVADPPKLPFRTIDGIPANILASATPAPPPPPAAMKNDRTKLPMLTSEVVQPQPEIPLNNPRLNVPVMKGVPVAPDVSARLTNPKLVVPVDIVPAPPDVSRTDRQKLPSWTPPEVIQPPVQVQAVSTPKLELPTMGAVPPPVDTRQIAHASHKGAFMPGRTVVVPPAPVVSGLPSGSLNGVVAFGAGDVQVARGNGKGSSANGNSALDGQPGGVGTRTGGGPGSNGLVISHNPGDQIGFPRNASPGAIALGPGGSATNGGIGGGGGGSGSGTGSGTGSGISGAGPGAGSEGKGLGNSRRALGGLTPGEGGGGTGKGDRTGIPGVTIVGGPGSGGSGVDLGNSGSLDIPVANSARTVLGITVLGASGAGSVLRRYGTLPGARIYTVYIETHLGPAVLEFSDGRSNVGFEEDLLPPEPVQTKADLSLGKSPAVIRCRIDREGTVRDPQIVQAANTELADKLLAAIRQWRFKPVLRGDKAVDVQVMLGFGITTRD